MKKLLVAYIILLITACAEYELQISSPISVDLAKEMHCVPSSTIPEKRSFPINTHINPCDNFYQYACSAALACFQLREDRSYHTFAFDDSSERLMDQKEIYLKRISNEDSNKLKGWSKELGSIYSACMDVDAGKIAEQDWVHQTIEKVEKIKTKSDFFKFMSDENKKSRVILIDYSAKANLENSDWSDLIVSPQPLMTLPERSYYYNEALMEEFKKLLAFFYKTIGFPNEYKRAESVVQFQKGLAEAYPLEEETRKLETEKIYITREQLFHEFPNLSLKEILHEIPQRIIYRDMYHKSLVYVEEQFSALSLEAIKDIFLLEALYGYMDDAYQEFFNMKFQFEKKYLGGPNARSSRDERCARNVMWNFRKELDYELVDKLFPNFPTKKFEELVEKIRTAAIKRIAKNTWLSEKGKEGATKKLQTLKMKLVKPKNEKEWDLKILGHYDFKNRIKNLFLRKYLLRKKMIHELNYKRNKDIWYMNPLLVNAYYDESTNIFEIPVGILQYPFFSAEALKFDPANFGSIGAIVGHEISHGIDDNGAKYNERGILEDWMSPNDIKKFNELGEILIEQYNKTGHNGKLTLGENIADVTGLSFSYDAAFSDEKGSQEEKQRFYLQWARTYCGTMLPSEYQINLKLDPHSQTEVRVNEPLKHQEGFYKAFSCKEGNKMFLPKKKRLKMW